MSAELNPYAEDHEQASEYLRLALALLSKHHVPVSPLNYRLGYDAVSGKAADLKKTLSDTIGATEGSLDERLWKLYRSTYFLDDEILENIRRELNGIIQSMQGDIVNSGGKLASYSDRLNRFASILNSSASSQAIAAEVKLVIEDTRATEQSQRQFNLQLTELSNDMEQLRNELQQIKEESYTDALTGISNRKAFDTALEEAI